MKQKIFILLLTIVFFAGFLPALATTKGEIITQKTQLQKREFQTKTFDANDKPLIMKAMLNVLQDEGFIVNNANPLLGFISGTKEFDVSDKTINISNEFGISKAKLFWKGIRVATIEATANVTEYGSQVKVRTNFKRKLLNVYGNAQIINEINDAKYYQEFYSKVDKSIFIQKQKI